MASYEDFIAQFPSFANTNEEEVQAMLDAAELEIDREVWEEKADQGQMYLAAHKLALSPHGNAAQMVFTKPKDTMHGDTAYGVHYDSLVAQVSSGFRVA